MIDIERLAEILNAELTDECVDSVIKRWNNNEDPFSLSDPSTELVLKEIAYSINETEYTENDDYLMEK